MSRVYTQINLEKIAKDYFDRGYMPEEIDRDRLNFAGIVSKITARSQRNSQTMNFNGYSKEWLDRLNPYLNAVQDRTWEDAVALFRLDDRQVAKKHNLVVLSEGVWTEIDVLCSTDTMLRKIRAVTENNVYFDGSYKGLWYSLCLGSLNHVFRIDGHKIDLTDVPLYRRQDELLAFIKDYGGIADVRLPPVPKGILKI